MTTISFKYIGAMFFLLLFIGLVQHSSSKDNRTACKEATIRKLTDSIEFYKHQSEIDLLLAKRRVDGFIEKVK